MITITYKPTLETFAQPTTQTHTFQKTTESIEVLFTLWLSNILLQWLPVPAV